MQGGNTPVPSTPIEHLRGRAQEVSKLADDTASYVRSRVGELVGSEPQNAGTVPSPRPPSSIIDTIAECLDQIEASVASIRQQVNRI